MEKKPESIEKWGFPLQELYRLSFSFYKQNSGKALHLSYEDNLKLIAFKQQASLGPFDPKHAPELGVFDVIGRDRHQHWQQLGNMSREQAMEGFIDLLDTMCSAFRPYVEAVRKNRDETLKAELRQMEEMKQEKERLEQETKKALEVGYKEEMERRTLQDALNKQTFQQFKVYAEKQFPGNPEQQAVLIHQLQQEHYHQYILQLQMQNENAFAGLSLNNNNNNNNNEKTTTTTTATTSGNNVHVKQTQTEQSESNCEEQVALTEETTQNEQQTNNEDEYVVIRPADIWTRPDIDEFKALVSAGDGDGVLTIGHGDTVTVRVPTNVNGKCIFWEFATDNYDIGFGVYFEWSKPVTSEVTVHVSDSDDDEDFNDEDYLSSTDDLECGGLNNERLNSAANAFAALKAPISIIVPIYRRECFNEVYVGSHTYPGEGVYLLKFDNSYSIWRSKTLYYRVYYER